MYRSEILEMAAGHLKGMQLGECFRLLSNAANDMAAQLSGKPAANHRLAATMLAEAAQAVEG